ncbi:hypothetical protein HKD37_19G052798 [Glycine soja]
MPRKHALSAPLARLASHLYLLAPSVPDSLSQKSLTRAKRAFENRKPLKAEVDVKKGESLAFGRREIYVRDAVGQGSTKNLSFPEDSRF